MYMYYIIYTHKLWCAYATIGRGSQKFIRPCTIVLISIFGITGGKLHLCEYIYVEINTVSINQSIERV